MATFSIFSRFAIGYFCLVVIGFGSTLFHMTLGYRMQLLDELPMIYGASAIGYCLFEVSCLLHLNHVALLLITYNVCTYTRSESLNIKSTGPWPGVLSSTA